MSEEVLLICGEGVSSVCGVVFEGLRFIKKIIEILRVKVYKLLRKKVMKLMLYIFCMLSLGNFQKRVMIKFMVV